MKEKRQINFEVDTNILIDLNKYLYSPEKFKSEFISSPKKYCEIKALEEILKEDLDKGRDREIFLTIPQTVVEELDKGVEKYSGEAFRIIREFDILTTRESGKKEELFSQIYSLLRGRNRFMQQFSEDLFGYDDRNDCKIIVSSIVQNQPVLTSNINHFAGFDGGIEQKILERVGVYAKTPYVQKNYDLNCDKYSAYSISRFLQEFFPDKYKKVMTEYAQIKRQGGRV